MSSPKETTQPIFSSDFLVQCKSCNDILCHSKEIDKLYLLLNELALTLSDGNPQISVSEETKVRNDSSLSKQVDYQCVYREVLCKKCQAIIGIYYVATYEIMDVLLDKVILLESRLRFYSISQNLYENFREFCFKNKIIESNLDHVHLLEEQKDDQEVLKNNAKGKNKKSEEFPELTKIVEDVKQAFLAMNEGMKNFETRLAQSEQAVGTLLTLVDKIHKKVHNQIY